MLFYEQKLAFSSTEAELEHFRKMKEELEKAKPTGGDQARAECVQDLKRVLERIEGGGVDEEVARLALAQYEERIREILDHHSHLPSDITAEDRDIVARIAQEVDEIYPNAEKVDKDAITARSYFLYKECEKHPERRPPMLLATAAAVPIAISAVEWLIGVIVAYKVSEDAPKIAQILFDPAEAAEYNKLHGEVAALEKRKHGGGVDDAVDRPRAAGAAAPMPEGPDDLEPEGEYDPTVKGRIKEQQLPTQGRIRFIPDDKYSPSNPLRKGPNHGFYDKFGNEWTKGPSRTPGEPFEWDIQLSELGKRHLGWASKDGKHVNVSLKGKITH